MEKECPTCAGKETRWAMFNYCDKHDVCVSCGVHRAENKTGASWGVAIGSFKCGGCHDREIKNRIEERRKKGFDTDYTDEVTCPSCGYEFGDSWEMKDGEKECPDCECTFEMERSVSVSYSTYIKDKA